MYGRGTSSATDPSIGRDNQPAPEIHSRLRAGERLIWSDTPRLLPASMSAVPIAIAGLVWLTVPSSLLSILRSDPSTSGEAWAKALIIVMVPFFAIGVALVLVPVYRAIEGRGTQYFLTDSRLIIRIGRIGLRMTTFELDHVAGVGISMHPIDRLFGTGSLRFHPADGKASAGTSRPPLIFRSVKDPIRVAGLIEALKHPR